MKLISWNVNGLRAVMGKGFDESIAALDADMEAAACDYEKLNALMKEKETVQAELDALYEKWEALSLEAGD